MLIPGNRVSHDSDRGATSVEYSILLSLIAAVIVLAVAAVGADTAGGFTSACQAWDSATGGPGVCN